MTCTGCGGKRFENVDSMVKRCRRCGGLTGSMYLGDSYKYVLPYFDSNPTMDGAVYFDFDCVGSEGEVRRHGWYRPETKRLVQVG